MLEKDKQLLEQLVNSNGKDAILDALNKNENQQETLDTEYQVSFNIDCINRNIDIEDLQIEINSSIGDLPFIIDDSFGLDKVNVIIGFNDSREAAEINDFVCNLMFRGSVDDYIREAELFYSGNIEALGLPI